MPVFMSVFDPVSGNLCGSTRIPSITDSLFSSSAMFEPLPKPVFYPKVDTWVENNTGPLKPTYNVNRMGEVKLPDGFYHRWTEDEKRSHLSGSKTELELDVAALMRQVKSEQELRFQPKVKPRALYPLYGQPEIKLEQPDYSKPREIFQLSTECQRILRELQEQTRPVPNLDPGMIELAPIVKRTKDETVFKGAGHSHFSYVEGAGFHVTTEIPGLRQKQKITWHDLVEMGASKHEEPPKEEEGFFAHLGRFMTGG